MPTCASRIMLTSLAPSPIARVIGCSLDALMSFTICTNKHFSQRHRLSFKKCAWSRFIKKRADDSRELSAVAPCDSRAQRCSCDRSLEKYLCSFGARYHPGWASALQTVWPRRWSDQSRDSLLTTWKERITYQQVGLQSQRFSDSRRHKVERYFRFMKHTVELH